jgi:alpha-L-fucosidase 2
MLVFSKPGLIKLLPALPDKWTQGRAFGIACRGGIVLDLEWDRSGEEMSATLISKRDQKIWVKLPIGMKEVECGPERRETPPSHWGHSYLSVALPQGKPVRIRAEAEIPAKKSYA